MDKGIVYIGEPSLDAEIAQLCRSELEQVCGDMPVVWQMQDKDEKKCWLSIYQQVMDGLTQLDTKYVGICEHDCLYVKEHIEWMPPQDDTFYYNANHWILQWKCGKPEYEGMYSYWPKRLAMSQLVCNRELLLEVIRARLALLDEDIAMKGEFGFMTKASAWAKSGRPVHLEKFFKTCVERPVERFKTIVPNIDIRHGTNFTGPRRGKKRRQSLPHWGTLDNVKEGGLWKKHC